MHTIFSRHVLESLRLIAPVEFVKSALDVRHNDTALECLEFHAIDSELTKQGLRKLMNYRNLLKRKGSGFH